MFQAKKIKFIPILLKIKLINALNYKLKKFTLTTFLSYKPQLAKKGIYTCIRCKIYLIEGLKINMLISNKVLSIKSFFLNFDIAFAYIKSCGINI